MEPNEQPKARTDRKRPGPEPERLKIEGDWEEAVKKMLRKPKPQGERPQGEEREKGDGDRT